MHKSLALICLLVVSSTLYAQSSAPANATILAKIAALEQEIATLKAQLQPEPAPAITRPPTLAEAAAEAAKVKHEWAMSTATYTNTDLKDGPPVAAPPARPTPALGPEQARQKEYEHAALKDEMYWKARMQDVRLKLDADRTFLAEATIREADLGKRLHRSVDDIQYIRDRVMRATVESDWNAAVAEVGRLKALVVNDARAITTAEEEARRANVPPGWLRP